MSRLQRRRVIIAVGAILAGLPLAQAQGPSQVRRIGFLDPLSEDSSESKVGRQALIEGLREAGWILGRNLAIEYRSAGGKPDQYPVLAAELARLDLSAIVVSGDAMTRVLQKATATIPIVMGNVGDPAAGTRRKLPSGSPVNSRRTENSPTSRRRIVFVSWLFSVFTAPTCSFNLAASCCVIRSWSASSVTFGGNAAN